MLNTAHFFSELEAKGFHFFSGVPCSFLKSFINCAINRNGYFGAANEGDAVAMSSGAYLGGQKSCVLFQNSGLGNAVSPLTSLNFTFKIPILGFVTHRGEPGLKDEPQHELMGQITTDLLDCMKIPWAILSQDESDASEQLARANEHIERLEPFFFVIKKGTFSGVDLPKQSPLTTPSPITCIDSQKSDTFPTRLSALETIVQKRQPNSILLTTTGMTGRELCCGVEDSPQHLYMVGSMGCVSSLGLGLAHAQPEREIFAIDGDGALLMRMGQGAINGHYRPKNLCHILLDNHQHDSTGGQQTVSSHMDMMALAQAFAYPRAINAHSIDDLTSAIDTYRDSPSLTLIYLKTAPGSTPNIGRPKISPEEVKTRLMRYLSAH